MKKIFLILGLLIFVNSVVLAQESGNRNYGTQQRKPLESSGVLTTVVNNKEVYFIEANVLMNMKPDSFVAVFGIVQEGANAAESNSKLDAQIAGFIGDLSKLGVKQNETFVDFIAQNKIYDYTASGNVVTEKFSGFETKKNINVRYKDRETLEKIINAAAKASIFDLIEVKYVVGDTSGVRAKLFNEAVKVIKQKEANYADAFGIKMAVTNAANEKYDTFYPSDLYSVYQAFEAGTTSGDYNRTVIKQRKTKTFFYEPLDAKSFDTVINQMGIEPLVQFTLYLRMQYDLKK
ncbi:MAG: SIMPL domain-containing protein [Acidobacteriota bacterium]